MTALFIMDTSGWIHAHGDWRSLFGTWEVNHLTKLNQLFQDRLINTCFPARRLDITAHKTVSSVNTNQPENRQPKRFWLAMAWLSLIDGRRRHFQGMPASRCSAEAWFPPPACANHPSAFFWDQRRALGSLNPPQWLPAWCHASNLLLEASPRLSCGLDVQCRLINDRMIMRWLWKQIPV